MLQGLRVEGSCFAGGFPYRLGLVGDLGQTHNSAQTIHHLGRNAPESVLNVGDLSYDVTFIMSLALVAFFPWYFWALLSALMPWHLYIRMPCAMMHLFSLFLLDASVSDAPLP